jgi:peptide/nickel transport system substrate-binding protein
VRRVARPLRAFLRRSLLAGLVAATVAGCGGGEPTEAPPASAGGTDGSAPAAAGTVTPGGTLVIARAADTTSLDPADVFEGESTKLIGQVYDGLVNFKPGTTDIEPGLAERWESSPDGRTWTFHLRQGVEFHDGTPFDAAAVVFSLERQRDPAHPFHNGQFNTWHNTFERHVEKVEAIDPATVRVQLKEPFAPILAGFAVYSMSIVSPAAQQKGKTWLDRNGAGTGPFRLQEWVAGDRMVLVANESYWAGRPHLDRVIFRVVPDAADRARLLAAGEVDVAEALGGAELSQLAGDAGVEVRKEPGLNTSYLAMNTRRKPFDDVRVRQAVALALDIPGIVRSTFGDLGVPAKNYLPPALWGANDSIRPRSVDRERSRALLAEAGYPNGLSFTLDVGATGRPYMPEPLRVAAAIKSRLAEVGIEAQLRENEWQEHLDRIVRGTEGDYQACLLGWNADMPDPNDFLYVQFSSQNADLARAHQNISLYTNPRVDELVEQAQAFTDREQRAAAYREVQAIVHEEAPILPIAHGFVAIAQRKRVHGLQINVVSGNYGLEKVWVDADADAAPAGGG